MPIAHKHFHLIVTDTSPLFTLEMGGALDTLLALRIPVLIPDAVYVETTRIPGARGAQEIRDWVNDHSDLVRVVPTDVGVDQLRRIEEHRPTRDLGEASAMEVLNRFLERDQESRPILLFEDSDLRRRKSVMDQRIAAITTGDFLRTLERAKVIKSAEDVFSKAMASGRNVERQMESTTDPEILDEIYEQATDDFHP